MGADIPMVAVFDTAFHRSMPLVATSYAIDVDLANKHGIHRYGFHGIAHASMAGICAAAVNRPLAQLRLITLQLGNGCSATAIERGRSVDTSMGFTPLEGLMMGTRSGDVDPAVIGRLVRKEGLSVDEVERLLNERSGLLGVSGLSHDMRELLSAAEGKPDSRAALALDMFCWGGPMLSSSAAASANDLPSFVNGSATGWTGAAFGSIQPAIRQLWGSLRATR
jgi:acetate kinase